MMSSLQEGLLACARKQDQTATYIHLAGLRDSGKSKQEVYADWICSSNFAAIVIRLRQQLMLMLCVMSWT